MTLTWIESMLAEALKGQKAVIVMLHHGIVEHYRGNEKHYGEYLVDDFAQIAQLFATYHTRLVFTGHFHSQDITLARWSAPNRFVYDIETGSLITYPNPYRVVTISAAQEVAIRSATLTATASHPADFPSYSRAFAHTNMAGIAAKTIKQKLGVEMAPYMILGACNPPLAHRALAAEPEIGLLLPCNVIVYVDGAGQTIVSAIDPEAQFAAVGRAELAPLAREVGERLRRALAQLPALGTRSAEV